MRLSLTDVYWRRKWCNTWSSVASEHKWFTVLSEQCLMSSSRCMNMTPWTHIQPFNTGRKLQPLNTSGSLQGPTRSDPTEEYQPKALSHMQTMSFKGTGSTNNINCHNLLIHRLFQPGWQLKTMQKGPYNYYNIQSKRSSDIWFIFFTFESHIFKLSFGFWGTQ